MAKFLDLTGLGTFKEKMQEWANGAFRKKTDKVVSTDVTYKGKSLDEAIKSGEFKGEKGDIGPMGPQGPAGSDANVESITNEEIDSLFTM